MDWKEYLKQGSLAIFVTVSALYLSGMEYYLSLFHGLGTGVFFVVPMEYALYEGLAPIRAVATISVFCGMLGYLSRLCRDGLFLQVGKWRHLLLVGSVLLAWSMPSIGARFLDVPRLSEQITGASWKLFCWGLPSCLLSFLVLARPPKLPGMQRFLYFWAIFCFVSWSYFYSSLIGKTFALHIAEKQKAIVSFLDDAMQKEYAGSVFHPVMEKGDELILLRFPNPDQSKGGHGVRPRIVFVKRSFIKKIDLQ